MTWMPYYNAILYNAIPDPTQLMGMNTPSQWGNSI